MSRFPNYMTDHRQIGTLWKILRLTGSIFLVLCFLFLFQVNPAPVHADTTDPSTTTFVPYANNPIISGANLYAPAPVKSGNTWYNFVGGELNPSDPINDQVYLSTTTDDTLATGWSTPTLVIAHGNFIHANDPSVVVLGNSWYMALTTTTSSSDWCSVLTSSNGTTWAQPDGTQEVSFTGATVNTCARPSLIWDAAQNRWELYFDGVVNNGTPGQHVAYSTQTPPLQFTYQQAVGDMCDADIKLFNSSYIAAYRSCYETEPWSIHYASSTDGLSFTGQSLLLPANPADPNDLPGGVNNAAWAIEGSQIKALLFGETNNSCVCTNKVGIAYPESASAFTTNALPGLGADNVLDDNPNTFYSSVNHDNPNNEEWLALNLGTPETVQRLIVQPRANGYGFPATFSVQSSSDGTNWTTISGQSYTTYANPGSSRVAFTFAPITTQYIRIDATTLGADNYGTYYLQIADMFVQGPAVPLAYSQNQNPPDPPASAVDGNPNTFYSSDSHGTNPNGEEWLSLGFNWLQHVQSITITPRAGDYGFPTAFTLQYSWNGVTWTTIPGQSYTNYTNPNPGSPIVFTLSSPVDAAYIRIDATTLGADNYGYYYLQIAEMSVQ